MDLALGFAFEQPPVTVPWKASQADLVRLFAAHPGLEHNAPDHFQLLDVVSLGGMPHHVAFHYHPQDLDHLVKIELFRKGRITSLRESFDEWQRHLVATLGPPRKTYRCDGGFEGHQWKARGVVLIHDVIDRFGLEEHVWALTD